MFFCTRIVVQKGILLYEVLILANSGYFLISGIYHLSVQDNVRIEYSSDIILMGYLNVLLYIAGIFISAAVYRRSYYLINMKETKSSIFHSLINHQELIDEKSIIFFFIVSLFAKYVYYIIGGRIIYGGAYEASSDPLGYAENLLNFIWNIINYGLFTFAAINWFYKRTRLKHISIIIVIIELALSSLSRRTFVFNLIVLLLVYLTTTKKISFKSFSLVSVLGYLTVAVLLPSIFLIRNEIATNYRATGAISESVTSVLNTFSSNELEGDENLSIYSNNLATRGYIMSSNLELIEAKNAGAKTVLNGGLLINCFVTMIPYFLLPSKRDIPPPDILVMEHFNLPKYDHSENIPYAGFADFGFWGPLFYGLIIGLTLIILQNFCVTQVKRYPFASLSSLIYLFIFCLNFEGLPIIYFVLIRDIIMIYGLSFICTVMIRQRSLNVS